MWTVCFAQIGFVCLAWWIYSDYFDDRRSKHDSLKSISRWECFLLNINLLRKMTDNPRVQVTANQMRRTPSNHSKHSSSPTWVPTTGELSRVVNWMDLKLTVYDADTECSQSLLCGWYFSIALSPSASSLKTSSNHLNFGSISPRKRRCAEIRALLSLSFVRTDESCWLPDVPNMLTKKDCQRTGALTSPRHKTREDWVRG